MTPQPNPSPSAAGQSVEKLAGMVYARLKRAWGSDIDVALTALNELAARAERGERIEEAARRALTDLKASSWRAGAEAILDAGLSNTPPVEQEVGS
jgi:hypothetical protein